MHVLVLLVYCLVLSFWHWLFISCQYVYIIMSTWTSTEEHILLTDVICIQSVSISSAVALSRHFRWKEPSFRELVIS
jgi:hypothetical protein